MPVGRKIVTCPHCAKPQSVASRKLYFQCEHCKKLARMASKPTMGASKP